MPRHTPHQCCSVVITCIIVVRCDLIRHKDISEEWSKCHKVYKVYYICVLELDMGLIPGRGDFYMVLVYSGSQIQIAQLKGECLWLGQRSSSVAQ